MLLPPHQSMSQHSHHDPHNSCSHHDVEEEELDDLPELTEEEIFGPNPPPPLVPLRAGRVRCWFDRQWGFLRRMTVDGVEALRAVYPAVRNDTWKTVPPVIENLKIEAAEDHFLITFDARHVHPEWGIDFRWKATIAGQPDGSLTYDFDGAAQVDMKTNRTGLCVLHPIPQCAGKPVRVEHVDGLVEEGVFPELISPHQPFFQVRRLSHEVRPGVRITVTMEGDVFEMEDQRNWTDASFKTYGGPLSKNLPLVFPAGHRVKQTVVVNFEGVPAGLPDDDEEEAGLVIVTLPETGTIDLPSLGTRWAPEVGELDEDMQERLHDLEFGHYLVDVNVTSAQWQELVTRAVEEISSLGARIILRVQFTPHHQPELRELARCFAETPDRLFAVLALNQGEPTAGVVTLDLVRQAFAPVVPNVIVAAAPVDNFADMNRFRPPGDAWCAPPMCPQVHTFDLESIMENVQAQPALVATAQSFTPHPLLLGPVALLRRRVPDPRQGSLFTAAWTTASLAAVLPLGGLAAVTYHEHAGPMGILGFPVEDVFAGLAGAVRTAPTPVSAPEQVAALTVFGENGSRRVLLANLTRDPVEIALAGQEDEVMEFGPYAVAWLEA